MPQNEDVILKTFNLLNDLIGIIQNDYSKELPKYEKWRKNEKIIAGGEPFIVSLAKSLLIGIILEGIKETIKSFTKKSEEDEIVREMLKKMNKNKKYKKVKIEIKKTYTVKNE